jgi:hypothetical protein
VVGILIDEGVVESLPFLNTNFSIMADPSP